MKQFRQFYSTFLWYCKHINARKVEIMVLGVVVVQFLFPQASAAQTLAAAEQPVPSVMRQQQVIRPIDPETVQISLVRQETEEVFDESLPEADARQPSRVLYVTVTAYSSTPDQTDSTPCITANGYNVCEGGQENVVAANFLPFGTVVKMPEYFGDQTFTVQDRMNKRYTERVDVWMKSREAAKQFGVRTLKVEVY